MGNEDTINPLQICLVWILCGLLSGAEAQCYAGSEPDSSGQAAWVIMPNEDPCVCRRGQTLRPGGINIVAPARPVTPTYHNLLEIAIAVSTGLGSCPEEDGINSPPQCYTFEDVTGGEYHYQFAELPKSANGLDVLVEFFVRTSDDVYISLSSQNSDAPDMYEIVIGGASGKSVIRRCSQCPILASAYESSGWLVESEYMQFWVGATLTPGTGKKGPGGTDVLTVALGKDSETKAIVSYEDSAPLPVEYLGFKQGSGTSVASYRFCSLNLREN